MAGKPPFVMTLEELAELSRQERFAEYRRRLENAECSRNDIRRAENMEPVADAEWDQRRYMGPTLIGETTDG